MCSDQEVLEAVRASRSLAQVLAKLGIRQSGGTHAQAASSVDGSQYVPSLGGRLAKGESFSL
jgi:hypothetical protein